MVRAESGNLTSLDGPGGIIVYPLIDWPLTCDKDDGGLTSTIQIEKIHGCMNHDYNTRC